MGITNTLKGIFKKREKQPQMPGVFLPFNKGKDIFPGAAQYRELLRKRLRGE